MSTQEKWRAAIKLDARASDQKGPSTMAVTLLLSRCNEKLGILPLISTHHKPVRAARTAARGRPAQRARERRKEEKRAREGGVIHIQPLLARRVTLESVRPPVGPGTSRTYRAPAEAGSEHKSRALRPPQIFELGARLRVGARRHTPRTQLRRTAL